MYTLAPGDRLHYVPKHVGENVLPNFLLFARMVRWAHRKDLTAIRDLTFGHVADYAQLLTDVLALRNQLRVALDPSIIRKLDNDEEVFINLLATPGYEFSVGFFAILALGAAVSPLCKFCCATSQGLQADDEQRPNGLPKRLQVSQ
jgi:malonyl-CoA/methylmalonyl-CoA synthetase